MIRFLVHSVSGSRQAYAFGHVIGTNVTPLIRNCITYLVKGTSVGGQFGWGGTLSKMYGKTRFSDKPRFSRFISIAPNGWLIRFRNPELSVRAKASLIEFQP